MSGEPRKYFGAGRPEETIRLETQAKALDQIIERELGILGLKPNVRVLDAGCGTGAITRKIASKVFPAETFGIDVDPMFIEKAKKTAFDKGIKNIHFELGNIDNLPYDDGFFDLTFCRLVLMHVKTPVKTIAELRRVTRKGGIVAASDNDDDAILFYPSAPRFLSLWERYGTWAKGKGEDRYIGRKLCSIFSEAGLKSIKVHPLPTFATQEEPDLLRMLFYVLVDILELNKDGMIIDGVATAKDYEEAIKDVETFLKNAGAFIMGCFFLAVGECPCR